MIIITLGLFALAMVMVFVSAWNEDFNNTIYVRIRKKSFSFWNLSFWFFAFLGVLFLTSTFVIGFRDADIRKAEAAKAEVLWVAAQCPVYKSECGSKHKYSCEVRATTVGRNRVGDIFVDAYPLCAK